MCAFWQTFFEATSEKLTNSRDAEVKTSVSPAPPHEKLRANFSQPSKLAHVSDVHSIRPSLERCPAKLSSGQTTWPRRRGKKSRERGQTSESSFAVAPSTIGSCYVSDAARPRYLVIRTGATAVASQGAQRCLQYLVKVMKPAT